MPLTARDVADVPEVQEMFAKRGSLPDEVVHGEQIMQRIFYETYLQLGTPAQNISFSFDTGSGYLWVPGVNSTACKENKCRPDGMFDITKSSTWKYLTDSSAWGGHGVVGKETVTYSGQTLENFNLYVTRDHMTNNHGWFGQSPSDDPAYSFVQGLASAKKISRAVYSINAEAPITQWNRQHGGNPSEWKKVHSNVYYGGYDAAKYEGPLVTVDIKDEGSYHMPFHSFIVDGKEVPNTANKYTVVIDTGAINLQLPNVTVEAIATGHGGHWDTKKNAWTVNCDAKPVLSYSWGYTAVDVDFDQFVTKQQDGSCLLQGYTLAPDDQTQFLAGPHFCSKAFVIYDNTRMQISVARAKYGPESNVVEINGDIPGAVSYNDYLAGKPLSGGKAERAIQSTLAVTASA